jgi:hypothetical protein
VDFHVRRIFVNISLLVLLPQFASAAAADEQAILADGRAVSGRLQIDPAAGVVFRAADGQTWPARLVRKIIAAPTERTAPGSSPAHRVSFWGNESLSGTVRSIDRDTVNLHTPAGDQLSVPRYLVCKIEHFQGDAVVFRDDFEHDQPARQAGGSAQRDSAEAAAGRWSFRLAKSHDTLEYKLPEPIGSGWLEVRFFDAGDVRPGIEWLCELEFESSTGIRTLQVLLGWWAESYGLATPHGPSLPVQRLARRAGWNRLGVRFKPGRIVVLIDEAVLTHADAELGFLQSVRFLVRPDADAGGAADGKPVGYVDDLQIAETIGTVSARQPAPDADDVVLTSGDQLFGRIESATDREVTLRGEFGSHTLPWRELQGLYLASEPCPAKSMDGQRVRVQFCAAGAHAGGPDCDVLEGVLRDLDGDSLRIEHPHLGAIRIPRGQLREIDFLAAGQWLAIDSGYHHFGSRLKPRFQVAHPEGSERSWSFALQRVPPQATLVLHVFDMDRVTRSALASKPDDDQLRTYLSLNGQELDPLGINHRLPLNTKAAVRLSLPIPSGLLREGENVLRLRQTPQKEDPRTFDDCGVFGIGIEIGDEPAEPAE